jgi:hypothetical protein
VIGRRRRDRPDPHELAAERLEAGLEPFEPLPPTLRHPDRKRLLLYLVLGAVTVAILRDGLGRGAPPVTGSCTHAAFAFDRSEVREDGVVKWSVAGPSGAEVFVTADSTTVDAGRLLGPVTLRDCKASGRFGVVLKDGTHVLRVFLRDPDGATRVLGQRTLEVNAPR